MRQQALSQMGEISIRVSFGRAPARPPARRVRPPTAPVRARARNMVQGLCPPLTAMTKRPDFTTACRASAAMTEAASIAAKPASARTLISIASRELQGFAQKLAHTRSDTALDIVFYPVAAEVQKREDYSTTGRGRKRRCPFRRWGTYLCSVAPSGILSALLRQRVDPGLA